MYQAGFGVLGAGLFSGLGLEVVDRDLAFKMRLNAEAKVGCWNQCLQLYHGGFGQEGQELRILWF